MNRSLPIVVAALLLAGCLPNDVKPDRPLDVTRITPNAPSIVYNSGMMEPLRTAVFDQAAFADLWNKALADRNPVPALPAVDFAREFVVVAALGGRASGGYAIEVTNAAVEGGGVVVEVTVTTPGKDCPVTLAMTQPVDIVKVARPAGGTVPVRFVDRSFVRDCGP